MENITLVVVDPPKSKTRTKRFFSPEFKVHAQSPSASQSRMSSSDSNSPSLVTKFLTAGTAACIADALTFPLDTAKVRLQIQGEASTLTNSAKPLYRGVLGTLSTIMRTEGVTSWYCGLTAGLQRQMCFASIRIGLYDPMKEFYTQNVFGSDVGSAGTFMIRVAAGLTTGGMAVLAAQPTDVVKVRMQAQGGGNKTGRRYTGVVQAYSHIARKEGVKGLWKGCSANVARNSIVNVSELVSYDTIKDHLIRRRHWEDGLQCHLAAAFTGGFITTLVASPVDVVKTRYMNSSVGSYNGVLHCARQMFRAEGFQAFYKGFAPSYMRIGTWNVLFFVTYEQLKKLTTHDDVDEVYTTHIVTTKGSRKRPKSDNNNNNNSFSFDTDDWLMATFSHTKHLLT